MKGKLFGIFTVLVVLCTYLAFATADPWWNLSTSTFLKAGNIQNLLNRLSLYGILGIGVAFVIITSGIDLSVGSTVCLCGVLLAILLKVDYQPAEQINVNRVVAAERLIVIHAENRNLQPGTTIRYTGGVGSGLVLTVESSASADGTTEIRVRESLTRNEKDGRIVVATRVTGIDAAALTAEVASGFDIDIGDQLQLFKADGALTTQKISAVTVSGESTLLTLAKHPGEKYHTDAFAVVLRRHQRTSIPAAILIVLLVGVGIGLFHGLLITRVGLQPFVVTLCALLNYRGLSRWLAKDQATGFGELQEVLAPVATGRIGLFYTGDTMEFGIPIPFFVLVGISILATVFLKRTIWGRYMLAVGQNEEAARFSGINTGRITMTAYVICSVLAAIGGMLFAIDNYSVSPSSFGNSFELYAIAAAVLGGCSLRGGEGSILGVVIGTAVMQVLNNMIVLLGIPEPLELPVIGTVILIGVISDELLRRAAAKRRLRQSVSE